MTEVDELIAAFGGIEAIRAWNANGNSLLMGYAIEQQEQNAAELSLVGLLASLVELRAQVARLEENHAIASAQESL